MRAIGCEPDALISPADGRLFYRHIEADTVVPIKGRSFTTAELLGDAASAEAFRDGACLVVRLAPADYHRFCYIDDGRHGPVERIPGLYRAISGWSLRHMKAVFTEIGAT